MVDGEARSRPTDDITSLADTLMLALTPGGHERTIEAFTDLGRGAGLDLRSHHRLASGDVALVFRVVVAASNNPTPARPR